jgi:hypothetical protein
VVGVVAVEVDAVVVVVVDELVDVELDVDVDVVGVLVVVDVVWFEAAATEAVGADVAIVVPVEFDAITDTRSVEPRSDCPTTYVEPTAPEMALQELPQRCH